MTYINTSFVDLLRNFEVRFSLPNNDRFEIDNDFGFDSPNIDSNSESLSNFKEDYDGVSEISVVAFMNDVGNLGDGDIVDLEDNVHIDLLNKFENKIRLIIAIL